MGTWTLGVIAERHCLMLDSRSLGRLKSSVDKESGGFKITSTLIQDRLRGLLFRIIYIYIYTHMCSSTMYFLMEVPVRERSF